MKKAALVLAGGGAKGAFQAKVEEYLHDAGYRWQAIAGVSVGALNASMIATNKRDELAAIWRQTRDEDVYTGGLGLWRGIQLWRGWRRSVYDNTPLRRMLVEHYDPREAEVEHSFGLVSLRDSRYFSTKVDPNTTYSDDDVKRIRQRLLASTAIPLVFPPVGDELLVDGGVRNIAPISDVLHVDVDTVVVITTEILDPVHNRKPKTIVQDAEAALSGLLGEIIWNDVNEARKINRLVGQAEAGGVTLHNKNGRPLRHLELVVIEPNKPLGSALDFSEEMYHERIAVADDIMSRMA